MSKEEAFQGKIQFLKCDVDSAKDVARSCSIQAMPTFKVFQNGKEIQAIQGWNENKLRTTLNDVLRRSA
jgi:thioredoxin-like negative regulator of GroEL